MGGSEAPSGIVDCAVYLDGCRAAPQGSIADAVESVADRPDGFVWLGLYEPDAHQLAGIAAAFHLHPLAVEDAVKAHQRPKLERYGDSIFVVLKTAQYAVHEQLTAVSEVVTVGEVMVFLGPNFVVTVRHGQHGELTALRSSMEAEPELLRHGPAAVLYAIADQVVDGYLMVAAEVQADIDEVEADVFGPSSRGADTGRIYQLKREVLEFRRAVQPLALPLRALMEGRVDLVRAEIQKYFRDVDDHLLRVTEQVAGFDELLNSILQANLAQLSVAQNEDMRKISAWVAIAAVPTAVAGIYGMNFEHMPELHQVWGYPAVLAGMFTACLLLYRGFRRNGWL